MTCKDGRFNTGNPICSNKPQDLHDNAMIIDAFTNSDTDFVEDRFGVERKTIAGIEKDAQDAIDGFEQFIDDKIIAQGGVEIADEWGDSPDKVLSQEFLSSNIARRINNIKLNNTVQNKLRSKKPVKILCIGDSNTYGHDVTSVDVLPPDDGHAFTRAMIQYPKAMEDELKKMYGYNDITVVNLGFSGYGIQETLDRKAWEQHLNADMSIVMLGNNDASESNYNNFTAKMFELTSILIDLNIGVKISATLPSRVGGNKGSSTYSLWNAISEISTSIGSKELNPFDFVLNYAPDDIYSDNVHLNKNGYQILGNIFAWTLFGGEVVHNDSSITPSSYNTLTNGVWATSVIGRSVNRRNLRLSSTTDNYASFSFYSNFDIVDVYVSGDMRSGSTVYVDSTNIPQKYLNTEVNISQEKVLNIEANTITDYSRNAYLCRIIGKGYHNIRIETNGNLSNPLFISSFSFNSVNENDFKLENDIIHITEQKYVKLLPNFSATNPSPTRSDAEFMDVDKRIFSNTLISGNTMLRSFPVRVEIYENSETPPSEVSKYSDCYIVKSLNGTYDIVQKYSSSDLVTKVVGFEIHDSFCRLILERQRPSWIKFVLTKQEFNQFNGYPV